MKIGAFFICFHWETTVPCLDLRSFRPPPLGRRFGESMPFGAAVGAGTLSLPRAFQSLALKHSANRPSSRLSRGILFSEPDSLPQGHGRVARLGKETGDDGLLDYLCLRAGGRFVRRSEMPSLLRRWWAQIKMEMAGLIQAVASRQPPEDFNRQAGGFPVPLPAGGRGAGFSRPFKARPCGNIADRCPGSRN